MNIYLSNFLTIFTFLLVIVASLPTIYQFQLKDYLLYRIFSGEKKPFRLIEFKLPAKSLRNIIIFGISSLLNLLTFYFLLTATFIVSDWLRLLVLIAWIIVAKLYVFVAMLISNLAADFKRKQLLKKAHIKLQQFPDLKVIGITGSYGKTSVKENIYQILASKFKVAKTPNNNNTLLGHSLAVLNELKEGDKYMVAEYGAYKKGNIQETATLLKPNIAVLTGLGNQHLELFGSHDNLIQAKSELFKALPADGVAYLNYDTPNYGLFSAAVKSKKVNYSLKDSTAELVAKNVVVDPTGDSKFEVNYSGKSYQFHAKVLGNHNVLNLLPAIGIAFDLGMNQSEIQLGLDQIEPPKERLNLIKIGNLKVLDDSYNSNFEGFIAALDVLHSLGGELNVVSKGLLELGAVKSQVYKEVVLKLNENDATLWTTDPLFASFGVKKLKSFKDEELLFNELLASFNEKVTLLIEGRVHPKLKADFLNELREKFNI